MLPRRADQGQQACRDAPRQAGLVLGKCRRRPSHGLPRRRISQDARNVSSQGFRRTCPIRGFDQGMGSAQPRDDFTKIEVMWTNQDGAAKPGRFQRVLAPMRHQGTANQRNPRQAIESPNSPSVSAT